MKKLSSVLLIILAILSVVMAVVYLTHSAGNLPHFFPGYQAGSSHKHTKHAIAFIAVAVVLLLAAWMTSGSKQSTPAGSDQNQDRDTERPS